MDIRGKRILVIGGAGLIGSHVVEELLGDEVKEVIVYDNFCRGTHENLQESLKDPRCRIFEIGGDILQADILDAAMKGTGEVAPGGAVPRLLRTYPNLYGDISAGSGYNALTRDPEFGVRFLNEFHDRLFFGTDICSPKNDHRHAELLRTLRDQGKISGQAFENIAWRNVNRVLQLGC